MQTFLVPVPSATLGRSSPFQVAVAASHLNFSGYAYMVTIFVSAAPWKQYQPLSVTFGVLHSHISFVDMSDFDNYHIRQLKK